MIAGHSEACDALTKSLEEQIHVDHFSEYPRDLLFNHPGNSLVERTVFFRLRKKVSNVESYVTLPYWGCGLVGFSAPKSLRPSFIGPQYAVCKYRVFHRILAVT